MSRYYEVFLHFLGILTLKKKPQELRYSRNIFKFFSVLAVTISYVNILILGIKVPNIKIFMLMSILINNFSFFCILYFFLLKNGIKNRFIQISSNLLGIEIINCVLFLSLIFVNNMIYNDYIPFLLSCSIAIWFLVVRVNIIRYSFNYGTIFSIIFLLALFFISFIISMVITFFLSLFYNII